MEVRARPSNQRDDDDDVASKSSSSSSPGRSGGGGGGRGRGCFSLARREARELGRAAVRLLKGQGSAAAYLFIPALVSLLWLGLCLVTTRSPSMSLEERLSEKYLRVRRN